MADKSERAQREEKILELWKDKKIFKKTLEKKSPKGEFVFYEGPPTANGRPGIHHALARAFKDAIPRYKTMRGYHVARKAGWDTHGLPVELEVEKTLGLKSKKEIEEYGVEKFNEECKKSVWKYVDEWREFTDRMGYWLDLDDPYVTYHNSYIEKVWSVIAKADKEKLLYKDYKVVPWCPRCGTALSSHELAQGYEDVKDLSVYAKFEIEGFEKAYFLVWTTTPWTLPGNMALAVGKDIVYVEAKIGEEIYVLAKDKLSLLADPYEIVTEHKGSEMVGMGYKPLYTFLKETSDKTYKIYEADFVNTEEGTGIVHIAPMYGQDDFELGTKVGLPKKHLVSESGHFTAETGFLSGKFVRDEETAVEIIKDLAHRGLLFKKEKHAHSYPHCWRCKTALIYYARDSWYIRMSELRKRLVKENEKINWEPKYIKEGRFGEWLREVKDWAISRERYWGTPLPVWESASGKRIVVDSIETLKKYSKQKGNKYLVMRHGESNHNVKNVLDLVGDPNNHLTDKGKKQIEKSKPKNIDLIFCSPFLRCRETAQIVSAEFVVDERLHEMSDGESHEEMKKRMQSFVSDIEKKYQGKNILIISHQGPIKELTGKLLDVAEVSAFEYEMDLHKPYIDEVILEKDGEEYRRTKEVMDVWLDSGAMPFASGQRGYPANFISEAIDQTRGWFYTLHAVGVIMDEGRAYENVICLGHILDKEGKKMSKSVGNVINPWEVMEKYGADAMRMWMYSVNQPGDSKSFDEENLADINRRTFNILDNVYSFYQLYAEPNLRSLYPARPGSDTTRKFGSATSSILDKWILTRLSELTKLSTEKLDEYKLLEPTRAIREFVDDLSTWYLRRSRERIKEGDKDAKATLYYVLKSLAKIMAPFTPFAAEELYQKLRTDADPESVHLESWPEAGEIHSNILENMRITRGIVSLGLEARSKANIKVRQPLNKLEARVSKLESEYLELVKDEVNVKAVSHKDIDAVVLDTNITPELEEEGRVRDLIRSIQDMRKERGLRPEDKMSYKVPQEFEKYLDEIKRVTNIE